MIKSTHKWFFVILAILVFILLLVSGFCLMQYNEGMREFDWRISFFEFIVKLFAFPFAVMVKKSSLPVILFLYFIDYLVFIGIVGWIFIKTSA